MKNNNTYWTLVIKHGEIFSGLIKDDDGNLCSVILSPSPTEKHRYENIDNNQFILSMIKFLDGSTQVNFEYLNKYGFENIFTLTRDIELITIEKIKSISDEIIDNPLFFNGLWDKMEEEEFYKHKDVYDEFHKLEKIF